MIIKRFDLEGVGGNSFTMENFSKFLEDNIKLNTDYHLILKMIDKERGSIFVGDSFRFKFMAIDNTILDFHHELLRALDFSKEWLESKGHFGNFSILEIHLVSNSEDFNLDAYCKYISSDKYE